jgi:hypothetical protein
MIRLLLAVLAAFGLISSRTAVQFAQNPSTSTHPSNGALTAAAQETRTDGQPTPP